MGEFKHSSEEINAISWCETHDCNLCDALARAEKAEKEVMRLWGVLEETRARSEADLERLGNNLRYLCSDRDNFALRNNKLMAAIVGIDTASVPWGTGLMMASPRLMSADDIALDNAIRNARKVLEEKP